MRITWLGLLMSVLFCACSEQNAGGEFFLRGQEVKIASANENLWPVFMSGDAMIATAADGSKCVGKITKNEWQKAEDLPKNDGQEDWGFVHFAQGNNGELILLNNPMSGMVINSLVKIPNADNAAILDQKKWERYDLKQLQGVRDVARGSAAISDTTILTAIGYADDIKHLFSVLDFKNQKTIPLDYWPDDEALNDTTRWYNYVAGCTILGNEEGKFLYLNPYANLAYIFSVDGTKVNKLCDLYSYILTETPPAERLSCCTNSDRIYMLLRDSNIKGEKCNENDGYVYGNTVEVFDWEGVKQQVIHLDNYYQQIMLSGDGNTLYLLTGHSDDIIKPAIYSYDISNLEDNPMIDSIEIKKICKANIEKTIEKYGKKDFLKEGDMMVDFELYDYNDKPHHLNDFLGKGKYTILVFNDLYCGWCQKAKPYLEKFYKQNKGNFEMITVSTDKLSEWKKKPFGEVSWHEWNDHNCAIDIQKKYDAQGTPTFFVINSEGKIVKKHVGFAEQVFDEMKDIVSGKK